jgi:hypothetical protein
MNFLVDSISSSVFVLGTLLYGSGLAGKKVHGMSSKRITVAINNTLESKLSNNELIDARTRITYRSTSR